MSFFLRARQHDTLSTLSILCRSILLLCLCSGLVYAPAGLAQSQESEPDVELLVNQILDEYGYLDQNAFQQGLSALLAQTPLPQDADQVDSGLCSAQTTACDTAQDQSTLPAVRDVKVSYKNATNNESDVNFRIRWKEPDLSLLPAGTTLSSYEVLLVRDQTEYARYWIYPKTYRDGRTQLPRRLRLFNQAPGDYQIYVRPHYSGSGDKSIASAERYISQAATGSGKTSFAGFEESSGGWSEGSGTKVTSSSMLADLAAVNRPLYDCLFAFYQDNSKTLSSISLVNCPSKGITSLSGLEAFTGLISLDLSNLANTTPSQLNQISDLAPLIGSQNTPVSGVLLSINLSGQNISNSGVGATLLSSLSTHLYKLSSLRYLSMVGSSMTQLPVFKAPLATSGIKLKSLSLTDNQLSATGLNNLSTLGAVHYLWLDRNPIGNTLLTNASGPLSGLGEVVSLSLAETGLSGTVTGNGLPQMLGLLYLRNNTNLSGFVFPSGKNLAYTYYISGTRFYCASVDQLASWFQSASNTRPACVGDSELGKECLQITAVYEPLRCAPNPPAGFRVDTMANLNDHLAQWIKQPAHWNANLYKLWYRESAVSAPHSLNVYGSAGAALQLAPLSSGFYQFAIQACNSDDGQAVVEVCGALSPYTQAVLAPLQPINLSAGAVTNNSVTLSWNYPPVPNSASNPQDFEISALFPVVNPLPAPVAYTSHVNGQWTITVNQLNQYPAGVIRVRACRLNADQQRVCGNPAELSIVAPPTATVAIAPPGVPQLNIMGSSGAQGTFRLNWSASGTPVDYYRILERNQQGYTGREYAVEETHMALKRYDHFNEESRISFEVQACQRDRAAGDQCSMPGMSISNERSVTTSQALQAPIGFCWYGNSAISNGGAAVTLYWEYPAINHVPERFSVELGGLNGVPPIGVSGSGSLSQAYTNVRYNPITAKWYWSQQVTAYASNTAPYNIGTLEFTIKGLRGNLISTGATLTPVRLSGNTAVFDESSRCAQAPNTIETEGIVGGPGELQPGHYSDDPNHRGSGWRFYWANELQRDETHQAFGISYDLIGFWYTYKLFDGVWSPVWYFTRMQLVNNEAGSNYFEGALVYPRGGTQEDLQVGTVRLLINDGSLINVGNSATNQNAWIEVNINHGDGMTGVLSHQLHDIVFDHPSLFNPTTTAVNIHDHYNGVWTPGPLFSDGEALANNPFYMVDWVERNLLSTGLSLFDTQGEPVWIASLVCATGCNYNSNPVNQYHTWKSFSGTVGDLPVFTVFPGNNPLAQVPEEWGDVSSHRASVSGSFGRGHFTNDPALNQLDVDFNKSQVCVEINFNLGNRFVAYDNSPVNGCAAPTGVEVSKAANLHGVDYTIAGDAQASECHLGVNNPACDIRMTWFTDSDYPEVLPYYVMSGQPLTSMQPLSQLCPASSNANGPDIDQDYVVADYRCNIDRAGNYVFLLVNPYPRPASGGGAAPAPVNQVIARSRPLTISGVSPSNPGVAAVPDTPLNSGTAHTLALAGLNHDPTVGALAGEAAVSGGAATYSIAVNVPPGRVGMQPGIGLSYSSRSGDGILGMGWSMSAGSSIHRCPQTIAQDGQMLGVRYQSTDRLCLDGQRLIHVGAGDYWANGSTYRTELDSFIEVRLQGNNAATDGSAVSFTVRTKNNRTLEFGTAVASRVMPQPGSGHPTVVSSWLLSSEQDPQSNRIDYRYSVYGPGEHLLDKVLYTGYNGSPGQREVRFSYVDRCINGVCDVNDSWSQGYRTQQTKALSEIRTCVNSSCGDGGSGLVREYDFTYQLSAASQRLLLSQAQECATQNGNRYCLPATEFRWGDQELRFGWGEWKLDRGGASSEKIIAADPMVWGADKIGARFTAIGDIDGDGTRELLISDGDVRWIVSADAEGKERWRVRDPADELSGFRFAGEARSFVTRVSNTGELDEEVAAQLLTLDEMSFATPEERTAAEADLIRETEMGFIFKYLTAADFSDLDNDGRVDWYGAMEDSPGSGRYVLAFTHWKGFSGSSTSIDDYFEPVLTNLPMTVANTQSGQPYVVDTPIWGDVTGDGLVDALIYKSVPATACSTDDQPEAEVVQLWVNQGYDAQNGFYDFQLYNNGQNGVLYTWPCVTVGSYTVRETASKPSLTDFNGDGLLDIALPSKISDLLVSYTISNITVPAVISVDSESAILRYLLAEPNGGTVSFDEQSVWSHSGPDLGLHSDPRNTFGYDIDINGDGLSDKLFVAQNTETTLSPGGWYLQINQGDRYAAPQAISIPAELQTALKPLPRTLNPNTAGGHMVVPQYVQLIDPVDWNSDGRTELMVPRRLSRAICVQILNSINQGTQLRHNYCPGSMDGSDPELGVVTVQNDPGASVLFTNVGGMYFNGFGGVDRSIYEMAIAEFVFNPTTNSYALRLVESPNANDRILAAANSQVGDFNGDGIIDIVTPYGCPESNPAAPTTTNPATRTRCTTDHGFIAEPLITYPDLPYFDDFHCRYDSAASDGIDCGPNHINSKRGYYIAQPKQQRGDVLDLILGVKDGLGNEAYWQYAPLSSSAPRVGTEVPLYTVPNRDLGLDYLRNGEDDHFYFTSSMYVVSALEQSNGLWESLNCDAELQVLRGCVLNSSVDVPLFNTTFYGYEEAVYNREGRGFQGFRKIVSEHHVTNPATLDPDTANDLRSVSIFHQIFPLAGQIEAMYSQAASEPYDPMQDRETNPASSDYGGFKKPAHVLSLETMDYACRNAAGAYIDNYCGVNSSNPSIGQSAIPGVYQPVMTGMVMEQYEPNLSTTAPYVISTVSGKMYDAYGNLTASTTRSEQYSQASLLLSIVQTVSASYTNDPSMWWLGRLDAMHTQSTANYPGMPVPGGLPAGMSAINQARATSQVWFYNALRQPICQYTYEGANAPANWSCDANERMSQPGGQASRMLSSFDAYGNPTGITVDGSLLDEQRTTATAYDTAGYFLSSMTNAAGHTVHSMVEPREGNTLSVQDANGWLTMTSYDAFGRMTQRWSPINGGIGFDQLGQPGSYQHYAPRAKKVYAKGAACGVLPPGAQYCEWAIADGAPVVWQALDSQNRIVESRSYGYQGSDQSPHWVYTAQRYNGRGQVVAETIPAYSAISSVQSEYRYDVLGRQTLKASPSSDATVPTLYTHYQHVGLTTTIQVGAASMPAENCLPADPDPDPGMDMNLTSSSQICVSRYAANGWLLKTVDAHGSLSRFWYDGQGNSKLIADPANNLTGANYNQVGQRTDLFDPNMGHWQFSYNGLGELLVQTDAKGQQTTFSYDAIGRRTLRAATNVSDPELSGVVDRWFYDPLNGDGLLDAEQREVALANGNVVVSSARQYAYDAYNRPAGYQLYIDPHYYQGTGPASTAVLSTPSVYQVGMEYESYFARVKSMTYPQERLRLYQAYDANGYLSHEGDSQNQALASAYRHVKAMNAAGQVTEEEYGNGMRQFFDYNPRNFQMTATWLQSATTSLSHYAYEYDVFGNLVTQSKDHGATASEDFKYDHLHRLTQSSRQLSNGGSQSINYSYDALGNLTAKSDFGSNYSYTVGNKPNAVRSVTLQGGQSASYQYDLNGNLTAGDSANPLVGELRVHYDPYNKPFRTQRSGHYSEFWYGADNQRYFQRDSQGLETVYVGKLYEQKGPTKHQLYLGNYAVFTVDITDPSATGLTYLHGDRLGSMVEMSDAAGQLIDNAARGFDPFGKPREGDWSNSNHNDAAGGSVLFPNDLNRPDLTTRGFTGHEQLNNVALTHMNGRAYDYNLGRFLSVDPVIQFPANSQSLNPYSYVLNNPLAGTDPTGYMASICGLGKISRCEGGGVAYLKAKQNEDKAYKLEVSFNNGGQASITFRMNQGGGLEFFNPEIADIGAVSLRNAIACNAGCTAAPLVTTTTLYGVLTAAGAVALADSPVPGPADIVAIGIIVVGIYNIVNSSGDELPSNTIETGPNPERLKELAGTGSPNGFEPDPDDNSEVVNGVRVFRNRAPGEEIGHAEEISTSNISRAQYSGKLDYVVTQDGRLVVGRSGHPSLARGMPVQAAGEARFVQGVLRSINNRSGHYRPFGDSARRAAENAFKEAGFNSSGKYIEVY